VTKRRTFKGFKTAPSIRLPKSSVTKLQAAAAAAAAETAYKNETIAHRFTRRALQDAVALIDMLMAGTKTDWTHADRKRLEEIRALSIF
jgi:DNA polymerase III epsilon subunit-like protein